MHVMADGRSQFVKCLNSLDTTPKTRLPDLLNDS